MTIRVGRAADGAAAGERASARLAAFRASRLGRLPFYYGWVVVAVAFVSMGIGVNVRTAFSLLYPPILAEFGWPRGITAATFSIGFIASTLYSPAIGVLMDRLGPRFVISMGAILSSAGLVLTTVIAAPWQLYLTLGVLVVGGSVGMSYTGHGAFVPNWFARKRGLAVGVAFSGVGVGSIVIFPWLQRLIDGAGWRDACWTMALVLLVVLVPLNVLLQRQRPEEIGLAPDGDPPPPAEGQAAMPAGSPRPALATPDTVVDRAWADTDWTLARAVRTARFWWVFAGFACGMFAWYTVMVHQTQFLLDAGFGRAQAAYALGLVPLLGIIGQIGFGHLSDRIGREWGWTIGSAGFVACYALLLALGREPSPTLLWAMIVAQGAIGYALTPNYGAIPAEIFQGRHYGTIFGCLSVAAAVGASSGPWLSGWLYDRQGDYESAFWIALALSVLSCVCIWQAAPRKVRRVAGRAR